MQAIISIQHVKITDTFREYVRRKLTRDERHFFPVIRSHVVLHVASNSHRVDTTLHTGSMQWHGAAEDRDVYAAIERVVDKLDRQAKKHKEKVVDHHQEKGGLKNRPNT